VKTTLLHIYPTIATGFETFCTDKSL